MAIKARIKKEYGKERQVCSSCGNTGDRSVMMFDLKIGDSMLTVCDECANQLFDKMLKCVCAVNGKVKTPRDIGIVNKRRAKKDGK